VKLILKYLLVDHSTTFVHVSDCDILRAALDSNYRLVFTDLCLLKQKINMYTIPPTVTLSLSVCLSLFACLCVQCCIEKLRKHETRTFSRKDYQVEQLVYSVC